MKIGFSAINLVIMLGVSACGISGEQDRSPGRKRVHDIDNKPSVPNQVGKKTVAKDAAAFVADRHEETRPELPGQLSKGINDRPDIGGGREPRRVCGPYWASYDLVNERPCEPGQTPEPLGPQPMSPFDSNRE